ncbi:RHS repeat-associated core domain-containing protein [Pseudomonas soli]|uniref:RHS repeat-associated core domain-containing protein n=2 Tax=Pseudomonas soli TaxID=1306993 RepID=A0A1H9JKA1_9PSED|nr:RHS repeat-associated core domain-containing protein [Pseudomonas soli]
MAPDNFASSNSEPFTPRFPCQAPRSSNPMTKPIVVHKVTSLLATDRPGSIFWCREDQQSRALTYTAYGYSEPVGVSVVTLGFNAQHRAPLTGRYLLGNGYRSFSPALMRFLSPDSLSPFEDGGVNAYNYCNNDPINKVDPSGHTGNFQKLISFEPDIFTSIIKHLSLEDLVSLSNTSRLTNKLTAPALGKYDDQLPARARIISAKTGGIRQMPASARKNLNVAPLPFFRDVLHIKQEDGPLELLRLLREAKEERARWNEAISSTDSTPYNSDSEDEMQRVNKGIRRAIYGPQL